MTLPQSENGGLPVVPAEWYDRAFVVLMILLTAIVALTFTHYGVSWDERFCVMRGDIAIAFFESLGQERPSLVGVEGERTIIPLYGSFSALLGELAARALPHSPYEARHLVYALFGLLGIIATWNLARFLAGPAAGFWAVLLLALTPMWYGHMFINPKDIPYAALHTWSLVLILRALETFPRVAVGRAALLGAVIGLTAAVRVAGIVLLPLFFLLVAALAVSLPPQQRTPERIRSRLLGLLPSSAVVVGVAWTTMCLFWPWAAGDPLRRPLQALLTFGGFPGGEPSRWRVPEYLWLQLPELFLALLGFGLVLVGWSAARRRVSVRDPRALRWGLVLFTVALPVVYMAVSEANAYNCMRHFLFILPPLACAAGAALGFVVSAVAGKRPALAGVALLGLAAYSAAHLGVMVRLHPYEYVYYNALGGGVAAAAARGQQTEYWATSHRQAVLELVAHLQASTGGSFETMRWRVFSSRPRSSSTYYFPPSFVEEPDLERADLYVGFPDASIVGEEIVRVERDGALFAVAVALDQTHRVLRDDFESGSWSKLVGLCDRSEPRQEGVWAP